MGGTVVRLPAAYEQRMREMLGEEEFRAYCACFDNRVSSALRVNTGKLSPESFEALSPFTLRRVPWITNGYYYDNTDAPSKHPYYYAGLYYLQEPSAMTPANLLPVGPGDRVLDLCAAPGGKSTELASKLKGTGLLVANDISATRAKALLKNLEVFGATNILVSSEPSDKLAERFPEYFDKILVDAPCSGEGMFRKQPAIMKNWEQYGSQYYRDLQNQILPQAIRMLRPGGMLLYSTCTFAPNEDEETVSYILSKFPDMELVPVIPAGREDDYRGYGFLTGRPDWMIEPLPDVVKCARLFPHRLEGEGHFVALFRKKGGEESLSENECAFSVEVASVSSEAPATKEKPRRLSAKERRAEEARKRNASKPETGGRLPEALSDWLSQISAEGRQSAKWSDTVIRIDGEHVYAVPKIMPSIAGMRVLRTGWYLGDVKKDRFEPSQACAMGLTMAEYPKVYNMAVDDPNVLHYLKCENVVPDRKLPDGQVLMCVDGFPMGFARVKGDMVKNRYLSGWRMM